MSEIVKDKEIRVIFFGETHGLLPEHEIIDLILKHNKIDCILYELLEEQQLRNSGSRIKFLSNQDSKDFSVISKFRDLKKTVSLAEKYKIPIIGCDITNMYRKDKNFLEHIDENQEPIIMKTREKKQREILDTELKKNKLILVLVGTYHLRKESELLKKLNHNHIIILPEINNLPIEDIDLEILHSNYDLKYKFEVFLLMNQF